MRLRAQHVQRPGGEQESDVGAALQRGRVQGGRGCGVSWGRVSAGSLPVAGRMELSRSSWLCTRGLSGKRPATFCGNQGQAWLGFSRTALRGVNAGSTREGVKVEASVARAGRLACGAGLRSQGKWKVKGDKGFQPQLPRGQLRTTARGDGTLGEAGAGDRPQVISPGCAGGGPVGQLGMEGRASPALTCAPHPATSGRGPGRAERGHGP